MNSTVARFALPSVQLLKFSLRKILVGEPHFNSFHCFIRDFVNFMHFILFYFTRKNDNFNGEKLFCFIEKLNYFFLELKWICDKYFQQQKNRNQLWHTVLFTKFRIELISIVHTSFNICLILNCKLTELVRS